MRIAKLSPLILLVGLLNTTQSSAEASFQGPESLPNYHPLCVTAVRSWEKDDGAFDMLECAAKLSDVRVIRTQSGGFYARQGDSYTAYRPLGSLDGSLELMLVTQVVDGGTERTSVDVLGRLLDGAQRRDYLTSIEDGGTRCAGGVSDAALLSSADLQVDINLTPRAVMALFDDIDSPHLAGLDNSPSQCGGVLRKRYNLLEDKQSAVQIKLIADELTQASSAEQQCYNALVADFTPGQWLDMDQFQRFLALYTDQCEALDNSLAGES